MNAEARSPHMERTFPRVALPGVDRDEAAALKDQIAEARYFSFRYSRALIALGKHIYANTVTGDQRKARRKTGKAQRAARKVHR